MARILSAAIALILTASSLATTIEMPSAQAFCGFYVSGADAKMFNDATQVVLMRDGTRTVLSMQNDYKGPPKDFALVIPVPVVLQKENVKTLAQDVFKRVDTLSSPRLVEYWEQNPCPADVGLGLADAAGRGTGSGFGSGSGRLGGEHASTVTVEAQFEVGEYEVVILSAEDSAGLYRWLKENKYKVPDTAESALRPYVAAGSKFFVAKVNVAKVKFDPATGRASLSPLRFHYDSERFELPVKLGLLNSAGTQDLIVNILAGDRYEVANYPNVTIPTNLDVTDATRWQFGSFYASLFDRTLEKHKGAVVTEYSWTATKCDPCPGGVSGLSGNDAAALGADVMPSMTVRGNPGQASLKQGDVKATGKLPTEVIQRIVRQNFGRFRLCYENGLRMKPGLAGKVAIAFTISDKGVVESVNDSGSDLPEPGVVSCVQRGFANLSFPEPEDKKKVTVVFPIHFASSGTTNFSVTANNGASLTLTRLHARYTKDSLGSDLIFRKAGAIEGGRESWIQPDKIATGATSLGGIGSTTTPGGGNIGQTANAFQGRYAIRHKWAGAITCKNPQRGIWGEPPPGVKVPAPVAATRIAYAPRGVGLAAFTSLTAPGIDAVLASAPTDPALLAAPPAPPPPPPAVVEDAGAAMPPSAGSSAAAPPTPDAGPPSNGKPPPVEPSRGCGCQLVPATAREVVPSLFGLALLLGLYRRSRKVKVKKQ
jgi:hypothetical protein